MGISTYQSYCGAQIFDAVGLSHRVRRRRYFTGTATTIEGAGLAEIAEETVQRHRDAFGDSPVLEDVPRRRRRLCLPPARRGPCLALGDRRATCSMPPAAMPATSTASSRRLVNEVEDKYVTIRSLFRLKSAERGRPHAGAARRSRAGGRDRQALLDRRHVLRLDQPRGAHHARHRHEPDRRQVEHRRRRRGSPTASRRCPTATRCARPSSRWPRAASA